MKNSSKILNSRNVQKNLIFSYVLCPFRGGDEIRSLPMLFCDEIKPPETVTFLKSSSSSMIIGTPTESLIPEPIIPEPLIGPNL